MNDREQWTEPTARADIDVGRQRTGIYWRGKAGPFQGEVKVNADGPEGSPATAAMTMLLVVTAASVTGLFATGVLWAAHVRSLALALAGLGGYTLVFVTCTIAVFRRAGETAKKPSPRPVIIRSEPQTAKQRNDSGNVPRPRAKTAARKGNER